MKKFLMVLILGLFAAGSAHAGDWDYVQGHVAHSSAYNVSGTTYGLQGSKSLNNYTFVQLSYSDSTNRWFAPGDVTATVGVHAFLTPKLDAYGKFNVSSIVNDQLGRDRMAYSAEGGVRYLVNDSWTVRGGVGAANLREAKLDSVQWYGTVGAEYAFGNG